jgi:uncharacterized protein DUF1579
MHPRASKRIAFCQRSFVGAALLLGAVSTAAAQAENANAIREHMDHLRPLVGSWSADYEFHEKDGTTLVEPGAVTVSWVLDDTYLQVQAEHHRREDPSRHHMYITYITYDPVTKKYVCTFFFGRSAIRVTEDGVFDEQTKELRTSALIPLEDGKRDEHVRNIYKLAGTDSPINFHYSQYSDEPSERLQLVIRLRRSEQSKTRGSN